MKKEQLLDHWTALPESAPLKPRPILYKHKGSTYGYDGVRIEGSPQFIDAVLGRLKDLLAHESATTRLGVAYAEVSARPGKDHNGGEYVCYVKIHERGDEAKAMNLAFGPVTYRRPKAA